MNILDLLKADGCQPKYKAATKGGEYGAACPFCGGKDRLIIHPNLGDGGRWWCRQCGRSGDCIQFLRDYRKMSFRAAAEYVGKEIGSFTPSLPGKRKLRSHWVPRETMPPTDLWQERARRLVKESEYWLLQPSTFGQKMLGWLKERRGLSKETIKKFRLGLVPIDRWEGHEQWGIEPVLKEDRSPKKIWLPRGLTIPLCHDGNILRIRIRRPKMDLKSDGDPRYFLLRGSDSRAMVLGTDKSFSIIVESELDALLLQQEAGDLLNIISLGNAQTRPDQGAAEILNRSHLILVALDADQAGAVESWRWWRDHYPQAHRWPPIEGKDPGDMLAAGVNIRTWVEAGLTEYKDFAPQPERPLHLPGVEEEPVIDEYHEPAPPSPPVTFPAVPAVPATTPSDPSESAFTCADCPHFHPNHGPNPRQGWGRCEKRRRGRFGCATKCNFIAELGIGEEMRQ
jgi:DNA primase